jgi:hypothetical protein
MARGLMALEAANRATGSYITTFDGASGQLPPFASWPVAISAASRGLRAGSRASSGTGRLPWWCAR